MGLVKKIFDKFRSNSSCCGEGSKMNKSHDLCKIAIVGSPNVASPLSSGVSPAPT